MTIGAGIERSPQSDKLESSSLSGDSSLSSGALALLMDGRSVNNPTIERTAASLPELSLMAPTGRARSAASSASDDPNLAMGNPSNATTDASNPDNYLHFVKDKSGKTEYVMSYNKDNKEPNWVSWQLDSDWLGSVKRTGPFVPDASLPDGFDKATPGDYTDSGYDRGHNIPSGDRTVSVQENEATFNMSNVAPQAPDNNRGPWEKLESYCRQLAKEGKEIYIIDGSFGSKGQIGNGINVPQEWFKVAVVLPQKGMGASDVNADTDVIAVEMPNENGIKQDDWRKFETTMGQIEKDTGYQFLSNVPPEVRAALENKKYNG